MIHKDMLIIDILRWYPQTKEVFARHAMPCDRCMGAVDGTLADGARMHGVPLSVLMRELKEAINTEEIAKNGRPHLQRRDESVE